MGGVASNLPTILKVISVKDVRDVAAGIGVQVDHTRWHLE